MMIMQKYYIMGNKIEETYPNYKVYLLAEDVNGGSMTDCASVPTEIDFEIGVAGDANADGKLDVKDIVRIKQYLVDNEKPIAFATADINKDGNVDETDLILIRKRLLEEDETTSMGGET